jgi:DNA processing protein
MAVPGNPMDARAGGCNALIRDGAALVRSAEDVAEALAEGPATVPRTMPVREPTHRDLPQAADDGSLRSRLLGLLGLAPVPEDVLIRDRGRPAATVGELLLGLELEGLILRHAGGAVSRAVDRENQRI